MISRKKEKERRMSENISRKSSLAALWKGNNVFLLNIVCPDNSMLTKVHNTKERVRDVIIHACKSLLIKNPEIFGLAIYENNEYCFISPRKSLGKILPSSTIVTPEEAAKLNDANYLVLDSSTIKTCRLYLRVKHFYINVDILSGQLLHYYYEQVRFDTIKQQNWLNLCGFSDVFYNIAARSLWLSYGSDVGEGNQLNEKERNLYYHLPQCQCEEESLDILKEKLGRINDDMKTDGEDDCISIKSSDADNEFIMLSAIKESLKLPFYGMYYYHVNYIRGEESSPMCCKMGVGPLGISVNVSADYTTWEEYESWNWSTVSDFKRDKDILQIHETVRGNSECSIHLFQCNDEKEAKYLLDELQEIYSFQMAMVDRYKRLRPQKQSKVRNRSIGILSNGSTSLFLSPLIARSASLTVFEHPRKLSLDFVKGDKEKTSLTLVTIRKDSCV